MIQKLNSQNSNKIAFVSTLKTKFGKPYIIKELLVLVLKRTTTSRICILSFYHSSADFICKYVLDTSIYSVITKASSYKLYKFLRTF